MRRRHKFSRIICTLLILAQPSAGSPALADHPFARAKRFVEEATYSGVEPMTGGDSPVDCLAENIDWLEHHIDTYGSIVAKQPDIWGEARLTKYRDEYERIMFQELTNFHIKINGSIAQQDSSFLAQALALAGAATGSPALGSTATTVSADTNVVARLQSAGQANQNPTTAGAVDTFSHFKPDATSHIELEPVIGLDQLSHYLDHLHDLRRINEGDDTSDSPGYSLNLVRIPVSILPGKLTRTGFGAEITITATPVITDDLMPTTFHNLAVNDVVELLGLPLVRTAEAQNYKTIPNTEAKKTFDQASNNILKALDETGEVKQDDVRNSITALMQSDLIRDGIIRSLILAGVKRPENANSSIALNSAMPKQIVKAMDSSPRVQSAIHGLRDFSDSQKSIAKKENKVEQIPPPNNNDVNNQHKDENIVEKQGTNVVPDPLEELMSAFSESDKSDLEPEKMDESVERATHVLVSDPKGKEYAKRLFNIVDAIGELRRQVEAEGLGIVPTGRARRELNPLNPSSLLPVMGINNLLTISERFNPAYQGRYIRWNGGKDKTETSNKSLELRVDLLDAQRYLQAELEAAHELSNQPEYLTLFASLAAPTSGLAQNIRADHLISDEHPTAASENCPNVEEYRHYFFEQLQKPCATEFEVSDNALKMPSCVPQSAAIQERIQAANSKAEAKNSVEALAWMLVVESALLNDRLNLDVRKIAKSKDVPDLNTSRDYLFFLPEAVNGPKAELPELQEEFQQATEIFKKYVAARWPMHVFAIDPQEQDQNVADVSARKRELQFALAVGFVSGQIGANSLTQYSRNLQTQIETISLNQTIVGFGHGDDTFGWRFQPRVQALPVPGTLGAIKETICGVSRDNDLRHRQLEPGQRECTAVVLMPSFVPYADFDVRSNWYALTNPKNAAITMKDAVHMSRAITAMRNSQECCCECADLYRDNEVRRLLKRVDQLDHELPLQTMRQLVPYGNTLGGFEMFNTGVTGLAPELIGWYGAPGINVDSTGMNTFMCGCTRKCSDSQQMASIVNVGGGIYAQTAPTAQTLPICEGEGTTLFLVGNNFSVNDTKVIAGGVCIPHVQLVSRSIMRVTIPSCAQTLKLYENGQENEYVAVYVATPYGVTNHLHVPTNHTQPPGLQDQIVLTPRDASHQTVNINASNATSPVLTYASDIDSVKVHVRVKDKLGIAGRSAIFKVQPLYNNTFYGDPVAVTPNIPIDADTDFFAVGSENGPKNAILASIATALKGMTSATTNTVELRLYYEAFVNGSNVPVPLQGPINVTVTFQAPATPHADSNSLPAAGTYQPQIASEPSEMKIKNVLPVREESSSPATQNILRATPSNLQILPAPSSPTLRPAGASGTGGCNCTMTEPFQDTQFQLAADFSELEANRSVCNQETAPNATLYPLRLVSDSEPTPDAIAAPAIANGASSGPTVPPEEMPTQHDMPTLDGTSKVADEQLSKINSRLDALQSTLQGVTTPSSGVAGQSVINVNIQQPKGVCARLFDNIETPILHRAFVKSRECWRNVRDQLPCGN